MTITRIPIDRTPEELPNLPPGYGFKGGVARTILCQAMNWPSAPCRDIDLVYCREDEDYATSAQLQEHINPEDSYFFHTIERIQADYFETRDFTCNELYYYDNEIICTEQACGALEIGKVQFTEHILKQYQADDPYFVLPHMMCKALRLLALFRSLDYKDASMVLPDNFEPPELDAFHMALHLDRACDQGEDVARNYVLLLIEYGAIHSAISTPSMLKEYLSWQTDYQFRHI